MNATREQRAEAYATHKKDCTCKGKQFSDEKYKAHIAGAQEEAAIKDAELKNEREMRALYFEREYDGRKKIEALEARISKLREALDYLVATMSPGDYKGMTTDVCSQAMKALANDDLAGGGR